ncbi:hypothetical protein MUK72_17845 (plasmid) [Halococcus dombrowskii]|uniref:Small CPxCG-related zinc finger protein n=1 Tax=Halococcus dombrowskii TaxID=179637 RepID=A0AAV3SG78_HALDO|nr:hypothetical protein [Halococcus dombrowskii]UOO97131.1 hypothetical protein MUK72_17845 [Halococcus dombrowskii]
MTAKTDTDEGEAQSEICAECGKRTETDDFGRREIHEPGCPNTPGTTDPYAHEDDEEVDTTPL